MKEEVKKILSSEPIKYYPSIGDAKRVITERNARYAQQIDDLYKKKMRELKEEIENSWAEAYGRALIPYDTWQSVWEKYESTETKKMT